MAQVNLMKNDSGSIKIPLVTSLVTNSHNPGGSEFLGEVFNGTLESRGHFSLANSALSLRNWPCLVVS